MPEPKSLDPFALFRDLVSKLEKGVNERAGPVLKSDEFASAANKLMSAAMVAKKLAQDLTQRYFEALNIPSRSDIVTLTDRLQVLEDRMIGIQATLDQMAGVKARAALPAPARTRKPPAAVIEMAASPTSAPAPAPARAKAPARSRAPASAPKRLPARAPARTRQPKP